MGGITRSVSDHQAIVQIETVSAAQTARLGTLLGRLAQPGQVLCLQGELGAGKTTLAQGLAAGLGIAAQVTSPSFALIQQYPGRLTLYHIDLFRLSQREVLELGLEEYLEGAGLCAIEWADRLSPELATDCLWISIELASRPESRRLSLRATGPRSAALLASLRGELDCAFPPKRQKGKPARQRN